MGLGVGSVGQEVGSERRRVGSEGRFAADSSGLAGNLVIANLQPPPPPEVKTLYPQGFSPFFCNNFSYFNASPVVN